MTAEVESERIRPLNDLDRRSDAFDVPAAVIVSGSGILRLNPAPAPSPVSSRKPEKYG